MLKGWKVEGGEVVSLGQCGVFIKTPGHVRNTTGEGWAVFQSCQTIFHHV